MNIVTFTLLVGAGATAVLDLWGIARRPLLGLARPDYAPLGRWVGHMAQGRFRHQAIGKSPPVRGERLIGWGVHYLTGLAFATLLLAVWGEAWMEDPTLWPAMIVGIGTLAAPLLILQPAMGAGIAGSNTPDPWAARRQSLLTHAVFGLGLYIAGTVAATFA